MFPVKHDGFVKKRVWCKVHWLRSPPGVQLRGEWDLLPKEQALEYKEYLEIVQEVQTESCERGLSVGFGKQETEVNAWMKKHTP